jgi:iduronate 2-sulfatase
MGWSCQGVQRLFSELRTMQRIVSNLPSILVILLAVLASTARAESDVMADPPESSGRLNVLFISIDDLRPQTGEHGHAYMRTPAIDQLARDGRLFRRHYVQVPTCGGSRAALLSGRYPRTREAYENGAVVAWARSRQPDDKSMPQLFRENGYRTVSIGKISHEPDGLLRGEPELPDAWDEVGVPHGQWRDAWSAFFAYADGSSRVPGVSPATEAADVPDDGYPDGLIAEAAIAKLRELKNEPFFLAAGFFKPHLPFNAPQRYWDLYDPQQIPVPHRLVPPANVIPELSLHRSGELTPRYSGLQTPGRVSETEAMHLRHAYAACISYIDTQVKRVLDELDALGLRESTIVVLWGDHGWHLGEHGVWGKHTLHEAALHAPLIVRMPRMPHTGQPTDGIVETVDIFPTLAQACGLHAPSGVDGSSFMPQLTAPAAPGKPSAFGFWARGRGHSVRTDRYRHTVWNEPGNPSRVVQTELYDHHSDPHETTNVAQDHPQVVEELTALLKAVVPSFDEQ